METEISELCRCEGINPTQYYAWKKTLLSSAARLLNGEKDKPDIVANESTWNFDGEYYPTKRTTLSLLTDQRVCHFPLKQINNRSPTG